MPDFAPVPRAAPTMVAGLRGPENVGSQRIIADMADEITYWMPSAAPLVTLTSRVRDKRKATQYRYDWMQMDQYPRAVTLAVDSAVGDTILDVEAGQGARIAKRYVLMNTRTREQVLVTATPAADAITVVRGIGGGEADMVIGDTLLWMRPVYPDGSDIGDLKSTAEAAYFNYTEIQRHPFGWTGRDLNTDLYGGSDRMNETKKWGIEHLKSIEYAFLFGKRHSRTGDNNHLETYTGGLEYWITSNVWDVSGLTLTERVFVEVLEDVMRWGDGGNLKGSGTKYLFASSRWITEIEFWAKDKIQYRALEKVQGLTVGEYVSSHGRVMVVKDAILDEHHPDMAFLLDLNHIRYVYHQGRDTKLLEGRQGNGLDGIQVEYFTDCGVEVRLEDSHAIFKGLA
jgi:hypothetical protein